VCNRWPPALRLETPCKPGGLCISGAVRDQVLAGGLEQPTSDGTSEALRLFYSAIELDPEFASAHDMAALCYAQRKAFGWTIDREHEIADAARLARRAMQVGKDDALALTPGGYVLRLSSMNSTRELLASSRPQAHPEFSTAWLFLGWSKVWLGQPDVAIEHPKRAMRLIPLGRGIAGMQAAAATAHFVAGRYDVASARAERLLREYPATHPGYASPPQAMQWPDGRSRHIKQWLGSGNWILRCVFPILGTSWAPIGMPKTPRDTRKECGKRGCPSNNRSLVLARGTGRSNEYNFR
jgi:tetratricopeptide (TPR) repeat protein